MLSALGSGIRAAAKRIDSGSEEVADYEVEIVENLLGVAYVTCQPQITAIVQAVLRLPDHGVDARALRDRGPRFDSNYSKVEVLWGLANYFKHRDEWSRNTWTNPPNKMTERTVKAITPAGLECGSSGNLRTGAKPRRMIDAVNGAQLNPSKPKPPQPRPPRPPPTPLPAA